MRKVKSILHNVYYASPSDSVVKLLVTKNKDMYESQIRVVSPYFMEIVNSGSNNLVKSVFLAKQQIFQKIKKSKIMNKYIM